MKSLEIILLVVPVFILTIHSMRTAGIPSHQREPNAIITESPTRSYGGSCKAAKNPDPSRIYGRIQFVDSFPDYKVQVVDSFPDLRVKMVGSFPDGSGEWQIVDSFPDFKIQIVDSFPDFKIQYVNAFPGVP